MPNRIMITGDNTAFTKTIYNVHDRERDGTRDVPGCDEEEKGTHQRYTYDNTVAFTGFLRLYRIYIRCTQRRTPNSIQIIINCVIK